MKRAFCVIIVLIQSIIGCGDRIANGMNNYTYLCGDESRADINLLPKDPSSKTPDPARLASIVGFDPSDIRYELQSAATRNGCLLLNKPANRLSEILIRYDSGKETALGGLFIPSPGGEDIDLARVELKNVPSFKFESVFRCGDSNLSEAANVVNVKLVGVITNQSKSGYTGTLSDTSGNKQSIIFNANNCASIPREIKGTLEVDTPDIYVKQELDNSSVVPHAVVEVKAGLPLDDKVRCEKRGKQWKWENSSCIIKSFLDFCSESDGDKDQQKTVQELMKIAGTNDCQKANDYLSSIKEIDLRNKNISSLYPIYYFNQLESIQAANNSIEDLQPLAKMANITKLALDANRISSIRYLPQAKGLKVLGLFRNKIQDINQFEKLDYPEITDLSLGENDLSDVSSLKKFTSLRELYVQTNRISSVEFLRDMAQLRILWIGGNRIEDISPMKDLLNLISLFVSTNRISDLSPLSNKTALINLGVSDCLVSDVTPLKGLSGLRYLILWRNKIRDISPIADMTEMTDLSIGDNPIESIEPLRKMTKMRELKMDNAQIADISPLSNMRDLSILKIGGNRISDLRPIKDLANISTLEAAPNPVFERSKSDNQSVCPTDAASAAVRNVCNQVAGQK